MNHALPSHRKLKPRQTNQKTAGIDHEDTTMTQRKKKATTGCYHCGSPEHRGRDCPVAECRLCGEKGHDAGGCLQRELPPVDKGDFTTSHRCRNHNRNRSQEDSTFTFAELFAGIGGFRIALEKLGGKCVFASELDRFARKNYQANFSDRPAGDICRIDTDDIPDHDVLVGGFPCQPFSSSGKREGLEDPRGVLFREIVRILQAKQPKALLLENVRGLWTHEEGKTLALIVGELEACGYVVTCRLVDAVKILPQERCRLYIVGIRKDLSEASHSYTFPIIPDLRRGVADIWHQDGDELSQQQRESLLLSPHQLEKVRSQAYTQKFPEARFLSDPQVPTKTLQSSYTRYMVGSQFIPASNSGNEWRRFSSREAARLQGFPEDFLLCRERSYHLLGNAVAPPVVAMLAAPLLQCIGIGIATPEQNVATYWGWKVSKEMLLEATPNDSRRSELESRLDSIGNNVVT
jgi:DNA (cytosine-5)-methyltransferase 1